MKVARIDFCSKALTMGVRAPKLLSTAIDIPIPSVITSRFPICASVDKVTPASGKLTAEKNIPSSLELGSLMTVENGQIKRSASSVLSAAKNVFPENAEVRLSEKNLVACISDHHSNSMHLYFAADHCFQRTIHECESQRRIFQCHRFGWLRSGCCEHV